MAYLPPPKSLDLNMHYFVPGTGDTQLPASLTAVLAGLGPNEYLIRGNLNSLSFISTYVYNPGSSQLEQFYDAYNVAAGDWLANDATGYTWKIAHIYTVEDGESGLNKIGRAHV
jgi:hypothetical protein